MKKAQRDSPPPTLAERLELLRVLRRAVHSHRDAIVVALQQDFGRRSRHESLLTEVFPTLEGIDHAIEHLAEWMQSESRPVGKYFVPARAEVRYQPKGVVGIISPWNFPVYLALGPLLGALAAGNRVMLKPSELTPATSELLKHMLSETFSSDHVFVVTGDASVGEAFSTVAFDHLLFTGSTRVGKLVMRAAAENLVPVTLELGGKSPVIVHPSFSISLAASRIMGSKLMNAGQICIAPDYVLVHHSKRDEFVAAAKAAVCKMYPTLRDNPDYTNVINARHASRLREYLADARAKNATVIEINPSGESLGQTQLPPTLVTDVTDAMTLMQEEIFGPILPIQTYGTLEEAIAYVNDHPRPLALYYFDNDRSRVEQVLEQTTSGGVAVNECVAHVAQEELPFGGVGPSGMGSYHGRAGFETFSHAKSVFYQSRVNSAELLRPPFKTVSDLTIKFLTR
jgi:coniferyl-aldehyde dehydrogenase